MIREINFCEIRYINRHLYDDVDYNIRKKRGKIFDRVEDEMLNFVYNRLEVIWDGISDDLRMNALNGRRKR